jgi:hypothetical protein
MQLFQSCDFSVLAPRVAHSSQPRAEIFNPFGIAVTNYASPNFVPALVSAMRAGFGRK